MNRKKSKKCCQPAVAETCAPVQEQRRPAVAVATNMPFAQQSQQAAYMPNASQFAVMGNAMPMGLAQYNSVDEYGRVYSPIMSYGPQPNSAPVPVAIPSQIVQLTPIVAPVSFVPYATQNQGLYQFEEEI
ncbi:MAG: hypothetical protein R3Y23_00470 [Bacillota bacterium]